MTGVVSKCSNVFLSGGLVFNPIDGCLYVCTGYAVCKIDSEGNMKPFAGSVLERGHHDGEAAVARFFTLREICCYHKQNSFFVIDDKRVRLISSSGHVATIAGDGKKKLTNGPALEVYIGAPEDVIVDQRNGDMYFVTDSTIKKLTQSGHVIIVAGQDRSQGHRDGPFKYAQFTHPAGLCFDAGGQCLYLSDSGRIRKLDLISEFVSSVADYNGAHPLLALFDAKSLLALCRVNGLLSGVQIVTLQEGKTDICTLVWQNSSSKNEDFLVGRIQTNHSSHPTVWYFSGSEDRSTSYAYKLTFVDK